MEIITNNPFSTVSVEFKTNKIIHTSIVPLLFHCNTCNLAPSFQCFQFMSKLWTSFLHNRNLSTNSSKGGQNIKWYEVHFSKNDLWQASLTLNLKVTNPETFEWHQKYEIPAVALSLLRCTTDLIPCFYSCFTAL